MTPRLSVVVATMDRHQLLGQVLDRLAGQQVESGSFEVVVAADAKEPDPKVVEALASGRPYPARITVAETPGVSAARNRGWRAAAAPLVLFVGDDMLPEPGWLEGHLAWHARHPEEEVGVLGHVRWARGLKVNAFMRWLEHGMQFDYPRIQGEEAGWGRFYAANASLKRSLLECSGGFDEEFRFGYEEIELGYRLDKLGFRLLYNPAAVVGHMHPATLEDWRRRMRVVGAAERQIVEKHPDIAPYFKRMFEGALGEPPARGRGARLARFVPRDFPWLGERVWGSADAYFRQQLAPPFMEGWRSAGAASGAPGTTGDRSSR